METLLDLLFPKYCVSCHCYGSYICPSCLAKVEKRASFKQYSSLWAYEGVIKKAIQALKYRFAYQIAYELADLASQEIKARGYFNKQDFILTSIPLHIKRERWRGFNQAEIIAKRIAANLGWKFDPTLLTRIKHINTQVGLHKKERLRNIRGNFAGNAKAKNQNIIIFDDVLTTGATLTEAMKVLKKAGARKVWGLTLAR